MLIPSTWKSSRLLEDCYSPSSSGFDICHEEHGWLIADLVESGVDGILIETMCTGHESLAASRAAQEKRAGKMGNQLLSG